MSPPISWQPDMGQKPRANYVPDKYDSGSREHTGTCPLSYTHNDSLNSRQSLVEHAQNSD